MYVVGVRNDKLHNFKIVFQSKTYFLSKIVSLFYSLLFNEVEVQNNENITIIDKY